MPKAAISKAATSKAAMPNQGEPRPALKNLKAYMEVASKYLSAAEELAGKPQSLSVVGEYLYWTQGKKQELFRVSTKDVTAAGERVIVVEERAAAASATSTHSTPSKPPSAAAQAEDAKLSKEEELLRERTRSRVTGISSYHVRASDGAVFFTSGLDVFVYYQGAALARRGPFKLFDYLTEEAKAHFAENGSKPNLHVQFAKSEKGGALDFSRITFVNNNNLYRGTITENAGNAKVPLSVTATPITRIGDDLHQCGVADYITQEEFSRYSGHYANSRYVVFSYTDMSMMRSVALLKSGGSIPACDDDDGTERMAYSRVGDQNARTTIVVYDTKDQTYRYVPQSALEKAAAASTAAFRCVEYIPRFGFKDEEHIYLSLLSRTQEEMAIVSCAIAALPVVDEDGLRNLYTQDGEAAAGKHAGAIAFVQEWAQKIPWAWVEVMPGVPIYFGKTFDVTLAAAAGTGKAHYHLYYRPAGHDASAWKALTSGEWNVRPGSVRVLMDRNAVAFVGNVDGRLKYTLYSVRLPAATFAGAKAAPVSSKDYLTRHSGLSEHVYSSFSVDADNVYFVTSNRYRPAEIVCAGLDRWQEIHTIPVEPWLRAPAKAPEQQEQPQQQQAKAQTASEPDYDASCSTATAMDDVVFKMAPDRKSFTLFGCPMVVPTLVTVRNRRGVGLSAHLYPAAHGDAPQALAVFVYGGPHVQLVNESDFDANCRGTVQALVSLGINVAVVDSQQATCNGLRDLAICKKNMGHFETEDYTDVVAFLTGKGPGTSDDALPEGWNIDATRVAIFGWSYGGYATLLAMSQAPNVFKMGFAGAPVGDWKLYDTGYTERYMGLLYEPEGAAANARADGKRPVEGPAKKGAGEVEAAAKPKKVSEQYNNSTIGSFAAGFPDEMNRVFIAHGLLDENVHFTHTAHVVEAMVAAGKPYNMLVYPGERHGLRQKKQSRYHHEGMLLKTMVELL